MRSLEVRLKLKNQVPKSTVCVLRSSPLIPLKIRAPREFKSFQPTYSVLSDLDAAPLYEVRASPRKGLGAFATRVIPRGTQIILEKPLVSVSMPEMVAGRGFKIQDMLSDLEMQFQALLPEEQAEYLALHDFRFPSEDSQSHLLTIFRSNAYTGDKSIGLFPKMARINHSCRPNSGNWWSEKQGHRVIYAAEDIAKGGEITVSYIPLLKKTEDRQTRLHQYGFTCDCSACHLASAESDRRRTRIANSLESLEQKVHSPSKTSAANEKSIAKALTLVKMVEEEGLNDYLSKAYMMAAVFNQRGGNVETAEMWARKELEVMTWAEEGSADVQKTLEFIKSLAAG
jgi:hypothetical protein